MGLYEIGLTVAFLIACALFALRGIKACAQAVKGGDNASRKCSLRNAFFLMALALIFLLCALYILFRISWFMMIVFIVGTAVASFVIGSGVAANMREH